MKRITIILAICLYILPTTGWTQSIDPSLSPRIMGRVTTETEKFGKDILLTYYAPPYFSLDAFQNVGFVFKFSADLQRRLSLRASTGLEEAATLTKYLLHTCFWSVLFCHHPFHNGGLLNNYQMEISKLDNK